MYRRIFEYTLLLNHETTTMKQQLSYIYASKNFVVLSNGKYVYLS